MDRPPLAPVPAVHAAGRFREVADVPDHAHHGVELVLVIAGRCAVDVAGTTLEARAGQLFVLPPRQPHNQRNHGAVETLYLDVALPARTLDQRPRVVSLPDHRLVEGWMEQLVELTRRESAAVPGLALAVVQLVAAHEQRDRSERALHPGLSAVLRRLESDLLEPLTIADLARGAELSPSHLTALFRERFGCGVAAYRQRRRLELAARLLADPYLRVAAVGAACGYADANLFARRFRAQHGCSPRTWRERLRQR